MFCQKTYELQRREVKWVILRGRVNQWMDCRVVRFELENPRWSDVSMSDQRGTNLSAIVYDLCNLKSAGLLAPGFPVCDVQGSGS